MKIRDKDKFLQFKKSYKLGSEKYICRRTQPKTLISLPISMLYHYRLKFLRKGRTPEEIIYTTSNSKELILSVCSANTFTSYFLLKKSVTKAQTLCTWKHHRFIDIENRQDYLNYRLFLTPKHIDSFCKGAEITKADRKKVELFFY